jgi:hypothetical protein
MMNRTLSVGFTPISSDVKEAGSKAEGAWLVGAAFLGGLCIGHGCKFRGDSTCFRDRPKSGDTFRLPQN